MIDRIVQLGSDLAWPAVVVFIFLSSKTHLIGVLDRVSKLKMQDFEMELRDKIVSLATEADQLDRGSRGNPDTISSPALMQERDVDFAQTQPVSAIMDKWDKVESAIYELLAEKKMEWRGILAATGALFSSHTISAEEVKLFNRLYEIRNIVAHEAPEKSVSTGYALEFMRTANLLLNKLRNAG